MVLLRKILKLILLFSLLSSSVNAGWIWDTAKKAGKGYVAGKVVKKGIDVWKKNTKKKIFTKKEIDGRTVYQQKIDPNLKITRQNPRTQESITETNIDRMRKGQPPHIEKNGKTEPIELHHSRQNDKGSLFELSKSTHRITNENKGSKALHPYGKNKNPNNPVPKNRDEFNKERVQYYKSRALEFAKGILK